MRTVAPTRDWRAVARASLRWLPGVVITILAFWYLASSIEWDKFLVILSTIPLHIVGWMVLIYFISVASRTAAWQTLLQRKVGFFKTFMILNAGYFLNNILPFRLGEFGRAWLMGRHSKLGMFYVLSSIVVERVFDLVIAAGLLLLVMPLALKMDWARPAAILILVLMMAGLVAMYLAARNQAWINRFLDRFAKRWSFIERWVMPALRSLLSGFSVLTRVEYFVLGFVFMALTWFSAMFRDWALIDALSPGAPFWWAVLAISASNLGGALPSAMASLGVFESAAVAALSLVGLSEEHALAYALIIHIMHIILSSLIGAYGLSQEGKSLAEIYADIRSASRSA